LENPEIAIKRAVAIYHAKGYPPEWIDVRIPNKIARERLEEEWDKRGIKQGVEFAILTNAISEQTFGINTDKHKKMKNLGKSHGLRDNMTPIELTLTTLAEQATKEIAQSMNAQGLYMNKTATMSGGSIAGKARVSIETTTGKKVVSPTNYLSEQKKNTGLLVIDDKIKKIANEKRPKNKTRLCPREMRGR